MILHPLVVSVTPFRELVTYVNPAGKKSLTVMLPGAISTALRLFKVIAKLTRSPERLGALPVRDLLTLISGRIPTIIPVAVETSIGAPATVLLTSAVLVRIVPMVHAGLAGAS